MKSFKNYLKRKKLEKEIKEMMRKHVKESIESWTENYIKKEIKEGRTKAIR